MSRHWMRLLLGLWPLLLLLLLLVAVGGAGAQKAPAWLTLSGNAPLVIAHGGFSGLFPDSTEDAYRFALGVTSPSTVLWCDLRLTKDGFGVCLPNIKLDNCTNIADVYPNARKSYIIDGVNVTGWFPVDYNYNGTDLSQVYLVQAILSRSPRFDGNQAPILTPAYISSTFNSPYMWLNVQHDAFYSQFNLSMTNHIIAASRSFTIDYISSPEINFLRGIAGRLGNATKLFFSFPDGSLTEPSTNQTYASLLQNLTYIKGFASGIVVPKSYVWPVTKDNYLQTATMLVANAHAAGLEVVAMEFANDNLIPYNYSYDPLAEYLNFIDNGAFAVDGVITDFPITPAAAIGCFKDLNLTRIKHGNPVVISHNGASGDYPDCTDLAYQDAVNGGADVIDCPVQVTKDGILVCMSSINLIDDTNVLQSTFGTSTSVVPAIQNTAGIFTFNLTWTQIVKNLKPQISNPMISYGWYRNPRYKNAGSFMKLSDFLAYAIDQNSLSGILITIEDAAFMAEKLGFDVVGAVISTLTDAGYNNQTAQKVMIQSSNSSVLLKFRELAKVTPAITNYSLVYEITEEVSGLVTASLSDIKKFADAVAVDVESILPENHHFTTYITPLVQELQVAGLPVYAYVLMNEALSQPYDFFSDATSQIIAYVKGANVDGIITDFPLTGKRYKANSCNKLTGNSTPSYMLPGQPGGLLSVIQSPASLPPAQAPLPLLPDSDVQEPPLPPVAPLNGLAPAPSPPAHHSGVARNCVSAFVALTVMVLIAALVG